MSRSPRSPSPEFEPEEQEDEERNFVLATWRELGRPGARIVQRYLRDHGHKYTEAQIAHILKQETAHQVFGKPWPSPGYLVAPTKNSTWQVDILDNTTKDARINQNYKYAVIVVDVYSRMVAAYPVRAKVPQQCVNALMAARHVMDGLPKVIETDAGTEFKGAFDAFCRDRHILHVTKDVDHKNGLGIVDSTIARLRRAIAKEQVENDDSRWVTPLRNAATALNKRPQQYSDPFVRDVDVGRKMMYMTQMFRRMQDKLRSAGKFRAAIGHRSKPSSNPVYSAKIHTVEAIDGTMVKDENGDLFRIWLVVPVIGGRSINWFPKGARPGHNEKDEQLRARLSLFAEALEGHLEMMGHAISMKETEARAWLNTLPGWQREGVPIAQLLELFPEKFEVMGRGADTRVRKREDE